jgi:hypothetical protein
MEGNAALEQAREQPIPEIERVLEEIADDARREPERYLEESRVPEGGE